ncbi:hypothetical protein [Streptomyces noursei]
MSPHQRKEIKSALNEAEKSGFKVEEVHNGHTWGYLICCTCGGDLRIDCTPRDAATIAKRISEFVRKHLKKHG